MSHGGYLLATQVLERLQQAGKMDSFIECFSGLKEAEQAQAKLAQGDFKGALAKSNEAASLFNQIPEAKHLLGICYADMSAAYGGLKDYQNVTTYAKKALAIVTGQPELTYTQGTLNMNLGNALYQLGDPEAAVKHLKEALRILEKAPGGDRFISTIRNNLEIMNEDLEKRDMHRKVVKNLIVIYVGTDDDIRSPLFSFYEEARDWPRAKSLVTEMLVQSCQESPLFREDWLDKLIGHFSKKRTTPLAIPDFDMLHDLEMKNLITIWQPFQFAPNRRPHPAIQEKVPKESKWLVTIEETRFQKVMEAWLHRRTVCASRDFGLSYASAVNLVEQMTAVQEEGISHQTTLCLLRMCADEMPSRLISEGLSDPSTEVSQREEFTKFVQLLTGVETKALYAVHSPLAENNPVQVALPLLGTESYDQIVLEDSSTRVSDLEVFRKLLQQDSDILDLRGRWLR